MSTNQNFMKPKAIPSDRPTTDRLTSRSIVAVDVQNIYDVQWLTVEDLCNEILRLQHANGQMQAIISANMLEEAKEIKEDGA